MAKIVVLDDQPDVCSFIQERLSLDGHEIRTSNVGDEAIDFGYLFQPDVLITDWRLGCGYDGLEVAEAFRFANQNIKTILITGHSIQEVEKHNSKSVIFKTISKPFSLEEIASSVEQALNQEDVGISMD
jgi:DNA-binding NtrC family response regulator